MRSTRVFAWSWWTMVGCSFASFGCSSTPSVRSERVATQQQRLAGAQKVCQLVGDLDYQTGGATDSLTKTNAAVKGTDLGYPVQAGNRIYFLFGDRFTSKPDTAADGLEARDPLERISQPPKQYYEAGQLHEREEVG